MRRARRIRELRTMPAMMAGEKRRGFVRSSWKNGSVGEEEGVDWDGGDEGGTGAEVVGSEVNVDVVTGIEVVVTEVGIAIGVLEILVEVLEATDNPGTRLVVVSIACGDATGAGLFPVFLNRSGIDCRPVRSWVLMNCIGAAAIGDVKRKRMTRQYAVNTVNRDDVGSRHHDGIVKSADLFWNEGEALDCEGPSFEAGAVWL
jgi:hypothetical protein